MPARWGPSSPYHAQPLTSWASYYTQRQPKGWISKHSKNTHAIQIGLHNTCMHKSSLQSGTKSKRGDASATESSKGKLSRKSIVWLCTYEQLVKLNVNGSQNMTCLAGKLALALNSFDAVGWVTGIEWWGYWSGYLSGSRCTFAYGPSDATATH